MSSDGANGASLPGVIRLDHTNAGEEARKERLPQACRVYIRQADLNENGCTNKSPKCQSIVVYGPNTQSSTPRSE